MREEIERLIDQYQFFHWHLEFPEVFRLPKLSELPDNESLGWIGGFDTLLSNPPWERIKLQEEEFFAARDPQIASAANKAARQKLINTLAQTNSLLASGFSKAKRVAEAASKFARASGRFPLTAVGDVNTYALFAEHARTTIAPNGQAGMIVPTGIATDDTTKEFFGDLVANKSLVSFFGFKNEEFIFPRPVEHTVTFGLLTLLGQQQKSNQMEFTWFAYNIQHMNDKRRRVVMTAEDFAVFNPNTYTCPIFRTTIDIDLNRKIYQRVPVLVNERKAENPWCIRFMTLFHMANNSGLFVTSPREGYVPLYEAKMIQQFDHRFGSYEMRGDNRGFATLPDTPLVSYQNPNYFTQPFYWVSGNEVNKRLDERWDRAWLLGFRDIARNTDVRTAIFSLLHRVAVGHKIPLIFFRNDISTQLVACFLANMNSLILDFAARQKVGGTSLSYFIVKQLPTILPSEYGKNQIDFITPRVLELVYTSWDMKAFAEDMGYHGQPFKWDEERRAHLRAELDAYFAKLYGLTRDELRYILDAKDVYGEDFPSETFRVLKEKELRLYGEYRTRRLVLEKWDEIAAHGDVAATLKPAPHPVERETTIFNVLEPLRHIPWIPVTLPAPAPSLKSWKASYRQAVSVGWLVQNFGGERSMPLFKAEKFTYFLQRANLANLEIPFKEFAAGPYSQGLEFEAGAVAEKRSYWSVMGRTNVVRGHNIKTAVNAAAHVIVDENHARQLIERLAKLTEEELGGLATVDFTSRAIYERGKPITPENILEYFRSDWPEKVDNPWFTAANISWAMNLLGEFGLFEKAVPKGSNV
jgi:hypothetical protein